MALKIVVFYNEGAEGFTETYYANTTTNPYAYINSLTNKQLYPLVSYRDQNTLLYAIRASTIGPTRQSYTYVYAGNSAMNGLGPVNQNQPGPTSSLPDVTSTDAFCALYDIAGKRRPLYVRGLNDSDTILLQNGQSTPSPYLNKGLMGHGSALVSLGWCIQWENRPPAGLAWYYPVICAPGTVAGTAVLTFNEQIAGVVPQQSALLFQGVNRNTFPGFPRQPIVYSVTNVGGLWQYYIAWSVRQTTPPPSIPAKMRCCLVSYQYTPINELLFEKFGERKTGRAFGVPRGRSRAVVKAQ